MSFQDPDELQLNYRNEYIKAIDSELPEVFEELTKIAKKYSDILSRISNGIGGHFWHERFIDWPDYAETFGKAFLYGWITDVGEFHLHSKRINKDVDTFIDLFQAFRVEYAEFIDRFFLVDEWLENHVRFMLKLYCSFPGIVGGLSQSSIIEVMDITTGPELAFRFPGMRLDDPRFLFSKERRLENGRKAKPYKEVYSELAMAAFKKHLKDHISNTQLDFKNRHFKAKGRPRDFDFIGYLVLWNTRQMNIGDVVRISKKEQADVLRKFRVLNANGLPYRRQPTKLGKAKSMT